MSDPLHTWDLNGLVCCCPPYVSGVVFSSSTTLQARPITTEVPTLAASLLPSRSVKARSSYGHDVPYA